ncbi:MAG: hypothetical protein ACOZAM_27220 [Pseudomonadota bacterium]
MTIVEEGLAAMRGCWRFMRRDPEADRDFNLTIDGFWRSFAMVLPLLLLMYPIFISDHRLGIELAEEPAEAPVLDIGRDYLRLAANVLAWPLAAALLAKLLGVSRNYVRYMVIYNWMSLPTTVLALLPHVFYLGSGSVQVALALAAIVIPLLLYVSWYVANRALETTALVAIAFVLAEYAVIIGMGRLIRYV